jgi:protocatechuate 3,4-dioxygenase beta subunit
MREHITASEVTLTVPGEKGIPMRVGGVVRDPDGKPVAGALVGAYHTDANGIYSQLGNEHPRIFGYMRTDANGHYAFNSIRPAAYPNTQNIEQHIHYVVTAPGFAELITESGFADDPIWKGKRIPAWAVKVTRDERGVDCCQFDMVAEEARFVSASRAPAQPSTASLVEINAHADAQHQCANDRADQAHEHHEVAGLAFEG